MRCHSNDNQLRVFQGWRSTASRGGSKSAAHSCQMRETHLNSTRPMSDHGQSMDTTSLDEHRRARLITLIERAFADVEAPGDDALVDDNNRSSVEYATVRDKFSGLHWRGVSPDLMRDASSDLTFMTPEAFRFFLPAHMIATLRHEDRFRSLHADLVDDLTMRPDGRDRFVSRFALMNQKQTKAIVEYLHYTAARYSEDLRGDVELALSSYWTEASRR